MGYTVNSLKKNAQKNGAQRLFDRIPTGRKHALKGVSGNRALRELIEKANNSGKEIIINVGNGYYRPDIYDEEDLAELEHYLNRECSRANEMLGKAEVMRETLNKLREGVI